MHTLRSVVTCTLLAITGCGTTQHGAATRSDAPPNIVIISMDDVGYADFGCYGAPSIRTPHIDRMAKQGVRFTSFYVAQPVCSASRAALLTGCYPNRIGINGALGPGARHGLHDDETTIAELCQSRGYATACFGKWHLGHHPPFLPTRHGFDAFAGIPYSNDMWPLHPDYVDLSPDASGRKRGFPDLPFFEKEQIANPAIDGDDQAGFTGDLTERSVEFIKANRDRPFLLYLSHPMPHVPLFRSVAFEGVSDGGVYGDVIEELDWSVGRILETLGTLGLDSQTLVIVTSDNGPWLSYGERAGTVGPLREGKGTVWEGGVRVPCVVRWPGRVRAGVVSDAPLMTIDLLPTIAGLIGADPPERTIDGQDVWPALSGARGAAAPDRTLAFYYHNNQLQALRSGRWKLVLPHRYRTLSGRAGGSGGRPVKYDHVMAQMSLYDLDTDIGETRDVLGDHPDVVDRLLAEATRFRRELGDSSIGADGHARRLPGRLPPDPS